MARFQLDPPPWARGADIYRADPVGAPFDEDCGERFTIACTVGGITGRFLIRWRARDHDHAEKTFQHWLDQGWAVMNRTFTGEPCRFVFRTHAISGFVVLPD